MKNQKSLTEDSKPGTANLQIIFDSLMGRFDFLEVHCYIKISVGSIK